MYHILERTISSCVSQHLMTDQILVDTVDSQLRDFVPATNSSSKAKMVSRSSPAADLSALIQPYFKSRHNNTDGTPPELLRERRVCVKHITHCRRPRQCSASCATGLVITANLVAGPSRKEANGGSNNSIHITIIHHHVSLLPS